MTGRADGRQEIKMAGDKFAFPSNRVMTPTKTVNILDLPRFMLTYPT